MRPHGSVAGAISVPLAVAPESCRPPPFRRGRSAQEVTVRVRRYSTSAGSRTRALPAKVRGARLPRRGPPRADEGDPERGTRAVDQREPMA